MPTDAQLRHLRSMLDQTQQLREERPDDQFERGYLAATRRVFDILGLDLGEEA